MIRLIKTLFLLINLLKLTLGDDFILETTQLPVASEVPTLSNGHIGFVVYGDSILMNGLYNGIQGDSHRARIPNYSNVLADVSCEQSECMYRLNMKDGYFETIMNVGTDYKVTQQIYAHRYYNRAIINRVSAERLQGTSEILVNLRIDPGELPSVDVTQIGNDKTDKISQHDIIIKCFETNEIEDTNFQPEPTKFCLAYTDVPQMLSIESGMRLTEFIHITTVGLTETEVTKEMQDVLENMATLFDHHSSIWNSHWEKFGISVDGNSRLNQIIHSSIFYLISNLPSESSNQLNHQFYGLSPSGIGKGGVKYAEYQGHSFWDTEMWMHPPILLLNPQWSKDILSYRYFVREAAKINANNTGFGGYRYPWESAYTGREVTPECCPEVVEFQHHVIADIAFAFRSHLAATHDVEWFETIGCDIAWNTAKFWETRVKFNETTNYYDIRHVMGPDEDHHDVDNNGYTNVNAAINLYFGDFAGCACKDILKSSDADVTNFVKIAKSLKLLYDGERDFHPQFEKYNGSNIKQADVVLLGFPLQLPMDASTKRNNLLIYNNVTRENGPAMTWAMHTVGFLDLKDEVEAAKVFERSFNQYTREPFKVWSEVIPGVVGAGNFITGSGGFLQSVINGYGGIRLHFDRLIISNFYVPPQSTSLSFNGITYLNNTFSLTILGNTATIKFLQLDINHPLRVKLLGIEYLPTLSTEIQFTNDQELIFEPRSDTFGSCVMKKTELGQTAGSSRISMNLILMAVLIMIFKFD